MHINCKLLQFIFTTNFHLNQSLNDSWQLLMSNHLFSSRNFIVISNKNEQKRISKAQHVRFKENEEHKNNILRSIYMIYDLNYLFMLSLFPINIYFISYIFYFTYKWLIHLCISTLIHKNNKLLLIHPQNSSVFLCVGNLFWQHISFTSG